MDKLITILLECPNSNLKVIEHKLLKPYLDEGYVVKCMAVNQSEFKRQLCATLYLEEGKDFKQIKESIELQAEIKKIDLDAIDAEI